MWGMGGRGARDRALKQHIVSILLGIREQLARAGPPSNLTLLQTRLVSADADLPDCHTQVGQVAQQAGRQVGRQSDSRQVSRFAYFK